MSVIREGDSDEMSKLKDEYTFDELTDKETLYTLMHDSIANGRIQPPARTVRSTPITAADRARIGNIYPSRERIRDEMTDWQPIETAPKDGTKILLFLPDAAWQGIVFGHYDSIDRDWWQDEKEQNFLLDVPPTHWMPLPEPPDTHESATSIPLRDNHAPRTIE